MASKFYYETDLREMPNNCMVCLVSFCSLPLKRDGLTFKKGYDSRRHPKCPLRKISDKDTEETRDYAAGPKSESPTKGTLLDYDGILLKLNEEKAACQYAYGGMIPVYYSEALRKAIADIKDCQECEAEATRAAVQLRRLNMK